MNRDSRILIYGSFVIMLGVVAASMLCSCNRMLTLTLQQTGFGVGAAGTVVAIGWDRWLFDDE